MGNSRQCLGALTEGNIVKVANLTKGMWSWASIEEGLKQKTRQNVVVLDWGSRSNATLGNFGVKV